MFLVDTNVWLERLLNRERSEEVGRFLAEVPSSRLFLTDFTLHSLGVILTRLKKPEAFLLFIRDLFVEGEVGLLGLRPQEMEHIIVTMERYHLDFDDAYQYTVAEKHDLTIVSFDHDFDQTERGRKTPGEVLQS
ncbi:type II toxin-antitoxin system VapC family toxin [Candidatus Caldatribacterium saccharofermentans]|uniref:PIN domain-containing protein n=1 Tax=Candidatus Caldatribacterium saccharofermentans TaxID=1454753 RepID=A0A7V4WLN2_9BACT